MKTVKAFYIALDTNKLRAPDCRQIYVGKTHTVECKPICCAQGLHASIRLIDALKYARGSQIYLVELSGDFDYQEDKLCATSRKYLKHFDARTLFLEFARNQALINIEKIRPYCSVEEFNLILEFLNTGNEQLKQKAESAARSAAESVVRSTAWSTAWSAARSTAWSAARSVARLAARSAAWSAESVAWSVAESAANEMLTSMLMKATNWDLSDIG